MNISLLKINSKHSANQGQATYGTIIIGLQETKIFAKITVSLA